MRITTALLIVLGLLFLGPGQAMLTLEEEPISDGSSDHEHPVPLPPHSHNVPFIRGHDLPTHDHDENTSEDHEHPRWNADEEHETAEYVVCRVYHLRPGAISISYDGLLGWVILDPDGCIYGTVKEIISS